MKPFHDHMKDCPKCGSRIIKGPRWVEGGYYGDIYQFMGGGSPPYTEEHLVWTCSNCGYQEETECKHEKN